MTISVREKIAGEIAKINPKVEEQIIEVLVQRELDKRSTALVQVLDKLSQAEGAVRKIKPDLMSFDEAGAKTSEAFSKARLEELNKAKKLVERLTKAINKALEGNDYGDIYGIAGGKDPKPSGGEGQETDAESDAR